MVSGLRKIKITQTTILDATSFEGTVTLSQSILNFDFILFGLKYTSATIHFTPVFAPSSVFTSRYNSSSNLLEFATENNYCCFYFPSATSLNLAKSNLGDKSNKQPYIIGVNIEIG